MELAFTGNLYFTRSLTDSEREAIGHVLKTPEVYGGENELELIEYPSNDGKEFDELVATIKGWPDIEIADGSFLTYEPGYEALQEKEGDLVYTGSVGKFVDFPK